MYFSFGCESIPLKYFTVFLGNNSHSTSWIQPSVLFVSVSTFIHAVATLAFEFPVSCVLLCSGQLFLRSVSLWAFGVDLSQQPRAVLLEGDNVNKSLRRVRRFPQLISPSPPIRMSHWR